MLVDIFYTKFKLKYKQTQELLYNAEQWWGETLANLANAEQFTKFLPTQIYM